ncbi:DMT family transporter [Nocardia amikacinitolerans]|uniref:DMT family transporter n=1 Tax=Nocardia amikacinitolerans TaxID=756689 RepID=UPI0020A44E12|nr:multidrug efflux SMR transporter [Nocardia amikacinitolerans]MCP2292548.1 quaternary ammonium compound-resistance protein SugE [Nocardia amikacinitolerans]
MAWMLLMVSAVFEAVWATALGMSDGLSRTAPTAVFGIALAASMIGLALATRRIPIGVAYAVWIGIGAALTVGYAMVTGAETVSAGKIAFLGGIIACVIGLKFVKPAPAQAEASGRDD